VSNLLKKGIPTVLAAMMFLVACSDNVGREPDPTGNGDRTGGVYLCFQMKLNHDGVTDRTRAGGEETSGTETISKDETPGTDMENKVNTLGIFVYEDGSNRLLDHVFLTEEQIARMQSASGLVVPILAKTGQRISIYAVANPTEKMRRLFSTGQDARQLALYSDYNDYWEAMDELIPGSAGHQAKLESNRTAGIPMTGIFKVAGSSDPLITITEEHTIDHPLAVSAEVSRLVAKMHVLAQAEGFPVSGEGRVLYVNAEDKTSKVKEAESDGQYRNWIGWIRLSDVRYMPNGTNKSTYVFPHENEAGQPADLNMDLTPYLSGNRFDKAKYDNDYIYYDGVALHKANIAPEDYMAQADSFSQARLDKTGGSSDPDRYTRGMYCPENYFDIPTNTIFDSFAEHETAIPMVTHLSIATKLTPRNIVVARDYADRMEGFVTEFEKNPDQFRRKYGLSATDFNDADVTRWRNVLKSRYFGETTLPKPYRTDFRIVKAVSEADAADLINWSLMANLLWSDKASDFEKGKYPASTFYVYDTNYDPADSPADEMWTQRYLYLTAGAVLRAANDNHRIKTYSVPHVSGWGYYYTYLEQPGQTADRITPYAASQVTRNTYYLVSVKNFGVPGGTITRPEYIKVNTIPVNWVYEGKGNIPLH